MTRYNGHRSWNAWNVALWIGNDEPLYRLARECLNDAKPRSGKGSPNMRIATLLFIDNVGEGAKTPDGAVYNRACVREALAGLDHS